MVMELYALILYTLVLQCTSASFGIPEYCRGQHRASLGDKCGACIDGYHENVHKLCVPASFEYCREQHRASLGDICGACIDGYHENVQNLCVPVKCPPQIDCAKKRREYCSASTMGECGECLTGYVDIEGYCVTEKEVTGLIKEIKELINEKKEQEQTGKAGAEDKLNQRFLESNIVEDKVNSDQYVDKKAETFVNGEQMASGTSTGIKVEQEPTKEHVLTQKPPPTTTNEQKPLPDAVEQQMPADKRAGVKTSSAPVTSGDHHPVINKLEQTGFSQLVFFAVVLTVSMMCVTSIVVAGVCWYRLYKQRKAMEAVDYTGYGSPTEKKSSLSKSESGDRKLAQSAQMYHYQHHKQQMMALEKSASDKVDDSEQEDEPEENEDGNYTVYECPGLAPTGEMEVQNPLFQVAKPIKQNGDVTPTSPTHSEKSTSSQ